MRVWRELFICPFLNQQTLIVCLLSARAGVTKENVTDKAIVLMQSTHGRPALQPIVGQFHWVFLSVSLMEASAAMLVALLAFFWLQCSLVVFLMEVAVLLVLYNLLNSTSQTL